MTMQSKVFNLILFVACGVFGVAISAQVRAEETVSSSAAKVATNTSVADVETSVSRERLIDQFSVSYQNVFSGPSLENPAAALRPDAEAENGEGPLTTENTLSAGYKINENLSVGPVMVFHWHPVTDHEFELADPYAKAAHAQLLNSGYFNLAADLRMSAPISEESRENGLITSLASEQVSTLEVGKSGFILTLTTFLQRNFHKPGESDVDDLEFHFKPAVGYRLLPNLLANIVYERKMAHTRDQDLTQVHNKGNVIQPGVAWDITKTLNFSPYVDVNIDKQITAASATVGASLNWQLL